MRTIALVLLLAACGPQIELSGYPAPPPPAAPAPLTVPPLTRHDHVVTDAAISGVTIEAVPYGAAGYRLRLMNETDSFASVPWDESTLVMSNGESAGRLIRGETRRLDVANAQPPTPLPPHASVTQDVLVEKLTDAEEIEGKALEFQREHGWISEEMREILIDYRARRDRMLIGGRLIVTVQIAGDKHAWAGLIQEGE